ALVDISMFMDDSLHVELGRTQRYCAHVSSSLRARVTSASRTCQMSSLRRPNSGDADNVIRLRGRGNGTSLICLIRLGCAVITTVPSPSSSASSIEWVM